MLHLSGAVLRIAIFNVLLVTSCGYALVRGGTPERLGGACFLLAAALSAASVSPLAVRFHHLETGLFLADILVLGVFLSLSYLSERFWPLWISGLQLDEVGTHVVSWIAPDILPRAYSEAVTLWAYPMLIILVIGTRHHRIRLGRYGTDNSWKTSSGRPRQLMPESPQTER